MNSRKNLKTPAPNPNSSMYVFSSDGNSRARRNLNETICAAPTTSLVNRNTTIFKRPEKKEKEKNAELQVTFAYNDYLRSLMEEMLVDERIKKNKEVIDGQLTYYNTLICQKHEEYKKTIADTERLKSEILYMEMVEFLDETVNDLETLNDRNQLKKRLETLQNVLAVRRHRVDLKNIKSIQTEEELKQLKETFRKLVSALEKILNSGRDFTAVHEYAEQIRKLVKIQQNVNEVYKKSVVTEKEAIQRIIAQFSEMLAHKYEDINSC